MSSFPVPPSLVPGTESSPLPTLLLAIGLEGSSGELRGPKTEKNVLEGSYPYPATTVAAAKLGISFYCSQVPRDEPQRTLG